jgi:hypothetical protein
MEVDAISIINHYLEQNNRVEGGSVRLKGKEKEAGRLEGNICMHWGRPVYWHTLSNSGSETGWSPPTKYQNLLSLLLGGLFGAAGMCNIIC